MGGSVSSVTQPPSAILASTEKPASPMTPVAPPLTDSKGSTAPLTAESERILAEPEDTGPGSFEDLHRKCKDLFPSPFEGGKLVVNKGLSNHFQISHTMTMSSLQPSGYKFGCTYVGTKTYGPTEAYPVMMGEIDPSGNVNANIIHHFTKALRCKFISQTHGITLYKPNMRDTCIRGHTFKAKIQNNKWVATQISSDYKGKNYVASVTLGNPDIINESGVMVSQYLQSITRNLALGAELLYQYGPTVPGNQIAIYTLAGRYTADKWQLSTSLTPAAGGVHLCYYQKAAEGVQVGVELEGSLRTQECTATVGYQIDLPKSNLTFRGQLDSNWCVGAVMEKKLPPLPFTFALSAFANHVKGAYRFGVGLVVG